VRGNSVFKPKTPRPAAAQDTEPLDDGSSSISSGSAEPNSGGRSTSIKEALKRSNSVYAPTTPRQRGNTVVPEQTPQTPRSNDSLLNQPMNRSNSTFVPVAQQPQPMQDPQYNRSNSIMYTTAVQPHQQQQQPVFIVQQQPHPVYNAQQQQQQVVYIMQQQAPAPPPPQGYAYYPPPPQQQYLPQQQPPMVQQPPPPQQQPPAPQQAATPAADPI